MDIMGGGTEVISDGVTGTARKYYALAAPLAALGGAPLRYARHTFGMSDYGVMKYLISDYLGSTVAITDNTGNVLAETRYMPFGEPRADAGSLDGTDKAFTGQRDVPGTGLMDYRARMYSPWLGRFIQPDTIVPGAGNSQAWNRYAYVFANPILYNDPTGHDVDCGIGDQFCNELKHEYGKEWKGFLYLTTKDWEIEKRNKEFKKRFGSIGGLDEPMQIPDLDIHIKRYPSEPYGYDYYIRTQEILTNYPFVLPDYHI